MGIELDTLNIDTAIVDITSYKYVPVSVKGPLKVTTPAMISHAVAAMVKAIDVTHAIASVLIVEQLNINKIVAIRNKIPATETAQYTSILYSDPSIN